MTPLSYNGLGRPAPGRRKAPHWRDLGPARSRAPNAAPVTLLGLTEAAGSGAVGSIIALAHKANPLDPHGWADDVDEVTSLGAWAAQKTGMISPGQAQRAVAAETRWRHAIPFGLADTSAEIHRRSGLYHRPANRAEEIADTAGAIVPYVLVGPEGVIKSATERAAIRAAERLAYGTARPARRTAVEAARQGARVALPVAAMETAREGGRAAGLSDEDIRVLMTAAGAVTAPAKLRKPLPGETWNMREMPREEVLELSSKGLPPEVLASDLRYALPTNSLLRRTDGLTVRPTNGALARAAATDRARERRRAKAEGRPYQGHVGHVPDVALTGMPDALMGYQDQDPYSNSRIGGMLGKRVGQRIRVVKVDGKAPGIPTPGERLLGWATAAGAVDAGRPGVQRRKEGAGD